jgi:hypothetical protein
VGNRCTELEQAEDQEDCLLILLIYNLTRALSPDSLLRLYLHDHRKVKQLHRPWYTLPTILIHIGSKWSAAAAICSRLYTGVSVQPAVSL